MWALLLPVLYIGLHAAEAKSSWECIAVGKERVSNGETFVPGPDYCTVCKCEKGRAHLCQAVLCQPPTDCHSFRLGESCCDFQCLDDMLPKRPDDYGGGVSTDLGLRMVASAVTAILSLALLLFLVHRLRQRRIRAHQQYYEDQLDSPSGPNTDSCHNNACCHNAAYCSGNDHVDFFLDGRTPPYSLWKPPSFYFPHEDAPPPYSEVVANSYRMQESGSSLPPLRPMMVQLGPSPGQSSDTSPGTLALIGAIGGSFRSPCSSSQPPCCITTTLAGKRREVALRSDEVYEDVDNIPVDLPPPYYPPTMPLNDLNRNSDNPTTASGGGVAAVTTEPEPLQVLQAPVMSDGNEHNRRCSAAPEEQQPTMVAAAAASWVASNTNTTTPPPQPNTTPIRLRPQKPNASPRKREGERSAAMEEFELRLSMDMSDSSVSSQTPTRTFSSSSDDSTSMEITSEMR